MILKKWNFTTHLYEPYQVPDDMMIVLYSPDMDQKVNCTGCFRDMTYGEGYTSRTIHNHIGLGYPVCEDCYNKEWVAEEASKS